jgi:hypothetical protein
MIFLDCFIKYLFYNKQYIIKTINDYQTSSLENNDKHCIMIVDNRFNFMSIWSVLISFYNIISSNSPSVWYVQIYTSISNGKLYKNYLQQLNITSSYIKIIETPRLDSDLFHMELYNAFLKNEEIWNFLLIEDFKKCLIVQDDGMLINKNNWQKYQHEYMIYDYIGAPWLDVKENEYIKKNINNELVGNGGFSLRDVKKSFEITQKFKKEKQILFFNNINEIPEDVYFVKCMKLDNAKICNFELAKKFSIEQVVNYDTAGFHKFWMYHNPQEVFQICNHLFEV